MRYPLFLGTGTEDYFNSGWYFWGVHNNPLSGLTRFDVLHDEHGWGEAIFEHSMYRHHVLDPIFARSSMRLGFEAGETGSYAPIFFRTFAVGYAFDGPRELSRTRFVLDRNVQGDGLSFGEPDGTITSALDAEHDEQPFAFPIRARRGQTLLRVPCPAGEAPTQMILVRAFDQGVGGQSAVVRVDGGLVDPFYEIFVNDVRRYAEDAISIALSPSDCRAGAIQVEVDARTSPGLFTESSYEAILYR
jgi:hypothetical protein